MITVLKEGNGKAFKNLTRLLYFNTNVILLIELNTLELKEIKN